MGAGLTISQCRHPSSIQGSFGRQEPRLTIHLLGFGGVTEVRAGKLIELELADGASADEIAEMCRKLLANTVIENFKIEKLENA